MVATKPTVRIRFAYTIQHYDWHKFTIYSESVDKKSERGRIADILFKIRRARHNKIPEGNTIETAIEVMVKHAAVGYSGRFEVHQPNHQKLALLIGVVGLSSMLKKLTKHHLLTCILCSLIFRLHLRWKISIIRGDCVATLRK